MGLLKTLWPYAFNQKKDIAALIISIVLQLVAAIIVGFIITILAKIPIVNIIVGLVGGLIDLYFFVGIVLTLLNYFKILK
ncbi:MAG: hypothetical protein J6Q89_03825 [Clostridia bacterium]|nr:hypothetical protein [Clostridia bacterium]